jgi:hypothetical protein
VYYARTYNWTSTGVMTGSLVVSTEYRLPAGLPGGDYAITVVANGISSDPFCTAAPSIAAHPSAQRACAGGSASFSVTVTGVGGLAYQWRRGTEPLLNGGSISGADTATLVIDPVVTGDAAIDYNVIVSNSCGSVTSDSAALTVCHADYNCDGFVDGIDYDTFNNDFEAGNIAADYNGDGFVDGIDYDQFNNDFEVGC